MPKKSTDIILHLCYLQQKDRYSIIMELSVLIFCFSDLFLCILIYLLQFMSLFFHFFLFELGFLFSCFFTFSFTAKCSQKFLYHLNLPLQQESLSSNSYVSAEQP